MGGYSIFALNLYGTHTNGIPINFKAVKELADTKFKEACRFPEIVVVGVKSADPTVYTPFDHKGAWISITPIELVHAFLFAIQRDIMLGEDEVGADALGTWCAALLSVPFHFQVVDTDEKTYMMSVQMRESVGAEYNVAYYTALQRIYMIQRFVELEKAKHGGEPSIPKIVQAYQAVKWAKQSEHVTPHFIEAAMLIWRRALSIIEVRELITNLDQDFAHQNPLNRVTSLDAIVKKVKKHEMIVWVFQAIDHGFRNNYLVSADLSHEKLTGWKTGGGREQ